MKKAKMTVAACLTSCLMLTGLTACAQESTHAHDYGDWIEEVPATCSADGVAGHYHCDGCGKNFDSDRAQINDVVLKMNNVHSFDASRYESDGKGHWHPATCAHTTERGYYEEHSFETFQDGIKKVCSVEGCGYEVILISELGTPENLIYADFVVTFDKVTHAESYTVELYAGEQLEYTYVITGNSFDLREKSVEAGEYTLKVTATLGSLKSVPATASAKILTYDGDVILEAEDAVLSEKLYSRDPIAHGGAYALGIDDCGQGLYFRYFAYEAGEREVDVVYSTANAGSFMKFFIGGEYRETVTFDQNTGWFGDSKKSATATVSLELDAGWNEIYLVKDGAAGDTPAWGGNAQIDYIRIHGTGKGFDDNDFDKSVSSYRLEAECADWHWSNVNTRPSNWTGDGGLSHNYGLGNMEAVGDGVKFRFKVAESGAYSLRLAYGGESNGTPIKVSVNGGEAQSRRLTGATGVWNDIKLDTSGLAAELTAGEWITVDYMYDGGWYVADYLSVEKIDHIHSFTKRVAEDKFLASSATCTEKAAYYYSCTECDEHGTETFEYGEPNGHSFDEKRLVFDGGGHWHPATCGHNDERGDYEAHSFVTDNETNSKSCAVEGCGYSSLLVSTLDAPKNLAYDPQTGVLSFDAVESATSYDIEIKKGDATVKTANSDTNSVNINELNIEAGIYTVSVTAKYVEIKSEAAVLEINVYVIDGDVVLEAENAVINGTGNIRINEKLHGGAYVGGINDCGQGLYFRYFAYEAGVKNIDVYYATATPGSFMKFFVNSVYQKNATFDQNTGWLGTDNITTAKTTVSLDLAQGWNEIYLIKDGAAQDTPQYGGNAEIDYILVHGSGKGFDSTAVDKSSNTYKLEAECAGWHWANTSQRPANWGEGCSLGYALGDINAVGDGVKYTFKVAESGTYKIQVAYGSGVDGIKFNVKIGDGEAVLREHDKTGSHNIFALDEGLTVELKAGETITVDVSRAENSDWLTFDYLLVTKTA